MRGLTLLLALLACGDPLDVDLRGPQPPALAWSIQGDDQAAAVGQAGVAWLPGVPPTALVAAETIDGDALGAFVFDPRADGGVPFLAGDPVVVSGRGDGLHVEPGAVTPAVALLGAPHRGPGGAVLLLDPSLEGADPVALEEAASDNEGDTFGASVSLGDVDGDGTLEAVVGAPGDAYAAGTVRVFSTPEPSAWALSDPLWGAYGTSSEDGLGAVVRAGADLDGDGLDDVLVCAPGADAGADQQAGACVALRLSEDEKGRWTSVWRAARGAIVGTPGAPAGGVVAVGDFDQDGVGDVVLGAPEAMDGQGAVTVLWGPLEPGTTSVTDGDALQGVGETGAALALAAGGGLLLVGSPGAAGGQVDAWGPDLSAPMATLAGSEDGARLGAEVAVIPSAGGPGWELLLASPGLPGGGRVTWNRLAP